MLADDLIGQPDTVVTGAFERLGVLAKGLFSLPSVRALAGPTAQHHVFHLLANGLDRIRTVCPDIADNGLEFIKPVPHTFRSVSGYGRHLGCIGHNKAFQ